MEQKRIKRCEYTYPYGYYIEPQDNPIERLNQNWIRLYLTKNVRGWERVISYDYKTYVIKDSANNKIKEICLFDVDIPPIEKIKEWFKCEQS